MELVGLKVGAQVEWQFGLSGKSFLKTIIILVGTDWFEIGSNTAGFQEFVDFGWFRLIKFLKSDFIAIYRLKL